LRSLLNNIIKSGKKSRAGGFRIASLPSPSFKKNNFVLYVYALFLITCGLLFFRQNWSWVIRSATRLPQPFAKGWIGSGGFRIKIRGRNFCPRSYSLNHGYPSSETAAAATGAEYLLFLFRLLGLGIFLFSGALWRR
jgi:hypothetical protein